MGKQSKAKSGGSRKIGRNKVKCASYKLSGTREKNRDRRLAKICKRLKSANGHHYVVKEMNGSLAIIKA